MTALRRKKDDKGRVRTKMFLVVSHDSIRGCVRGSVGPSVGPSVGHTFFLVEYETEKEYRKGEASRD